MRPVTVNTSGDITVACNIHFKNGQRGQKRLKQGDIPNPIPEVQGNIPRVSRLMALAIRFDGLINDGHVQDYADLARLGYVSRARITQIMNLLNLAPDIQEEVLFLPRMIVGRDPITERDLRPIVALVDWSKQRDVWVVVKGDLKIDISF